jgi:hypothetical protein
MRRTFLYSFPFILCISLVLFSEGVSRHSQTAQAAGGDYATGLVAQYTFDEGSGTTAADSTGGGSTGTVTSGATWVAGKVGSGALQFDGVNSKVNIPATAPLNLTSALTISAWIYPTGWGSNNSGQGRIFQKRSQNAGYFFNLYSTSTVSNGLRFSPNNGNGSITSNSNAVTLNQWQHVVVTYAGTSGTIYVNGVAVGSGSATAINDNAAISAAIGANVSDSLQKFQGSIDDVRVYNRALSANDVQTLYSDTCGSCSQPPPPPPPSSYTLTVTPAGTGSGTVSGTGISCGSDCSETMTGGASVTLTASAASGSAFAGWSGGGCSGTGSCTVAVSADTTVTATFSALTIYTLTVVPAGTGSGTVSGTGISCGSDCSESVVGGTSMTLTATPASGSTFAGWSGWTGGAGCSGTGSCAVTVNNNGTVTATFNAVGSSGAPIVRVVAPQAYTQWRAAANTTPGTIFDARGLSFYLRTSHNPDLNGDCALGGLTTNPYPVRPGIASSTVWGGSIIGDTSITADRFVLSGGSPGHGYCNSAGLLLDGGTTPMVADSVRVDHGWDGVRFEYGGCLMHPGTCKNMIKDSWISYMHDDCIENDGGGGLDIENTLFEGCYSGISLDAGATTTPNQYHTATDLLTFNNSLMQIMGYPDSGSGTLKMTSFVPFKVRSFNGSYTSPSIKMTNSVLAFEVYDSAFGGRWKEGWDLMSSGLGSCSNNYLLWMSDAPFPTAMPAVPACFTILKGQAARDYWASARSTWISAHPNIDRVPSDPVVSNPNDTDSDGVLNAADKCPNTPASLASQVNVYGCPKPFATTLDIKPDFTITDLTTASAVELGRLAYGKVRYTNAIRLLKATSLYDDRLDLDSAVTLSKGKITINSITAPTLNQPATITLYGLTVGTPQIYRDGVLCTTCTQVSYSGGTLVFNVTGFSTYEVIEAGSPPPPVPPSTSGGGGGSGSGGGGAIVSNTSSTTDTTSHPSGLTQAQIEAIIGLLTSFGADQPVIDNVRANLMGGTTSSNPTQSTTYSFTRDLELGKTGDDVKALQQFLNIHGYVITASGPGSSGQETTRFGALTKAALIKFQLANHITPAVGYFGPKTRQKIFESH